MKKIISIIFSILFTLCSQSAIFAYDFTAEDVIPCECSFVGKINIVGLFSHPITSVILGELLKDPKLQKFNDFCVNTFYFDMKKDINSVYVVVPDGMDTKSDSAFYFVIEGNFYTAKLADSLKNFKDFQLCDTGKGFKVAEYLNSNSYILLLSNKCLAITFNLDWFINNPDSPAYTTDPMHIYRVSLTDGKPLFSTDLRNDQNKLFAEAIRASYQQKAK